MKLPWKKKENKKETIPRTFGGEEEAIIDMAYQMKDEPEEFIETLENAFRKASVSKKAELFLAIGLTLSNRSFTMLALASWSHSLVYATKIDDRLGQCMCYQNIGTVYRRLGQYQKSIEYQEKALEIAKDIGNKSGESGCYSDIGVVYYRIGQYQKAIEYQEKALPILKEIGYFDGLSNVYINLALIYRINNPDKAFQYLTESINLSESVSALLVEEVHKIGFQSTTASNYELIVP